mmetsp:Transcript_17408/g.29402  ORF Transcript_17408/g.29402 Transcript_17408/m.29402 type:complete len:438 (-) Transcript_17408:147-1460(-)
MLQKHALNRLVRRRKPQLRASIPLCAPQVQIRPNSTSGEPKRRSVTIDPNSIKGKIKTYLELSKFRLSGLVVLTTGAGYICAGALPIDYYTMTAACIGTGLCAGSASCFNHVIEHEIDLKMKRTLNRPLPSGRASLPEATAFGVGTGIAGTTLLYSMTNPVVAALGLGNIALYAGAYTYSKRYTELNTWIGSIVGAIPPVMGWAAATGGGLMAAEPMTLAGILFLWQFPHFFALSYLHREDYARGNFQMVAVNDPTGIRSANLIMEYSLYLTMLPIAASLGGLTSYMFALEGTAANMYLLYLAQKFRQERTNAGARRIFLCSLWYLPLLLTGFVFHSRMWDKSSQQLILENADDELTEAVTGAKSTLKGLCVHEMISNQPNLCPKISTEKVLENTSVNVTAAGRPTQLLAGAEKEADSQTETGAEAAERRGASTSRN